MKPRAIGMLTGLGLALAGLGGPALASDPVEGWLRWRGPDQAGVSYETELPDTIDAADPRWTLEMSGRGAPVIANGRVFCVAYEGEGADLQESVLCLDEATGAKIWEHRFHDFLSDVIYDRYSITSPSIDPATGDVFVLTTPGLLTCFSRDGDIRWQHPMIEKFGRLTYPNGRTMGPLVDDDFVIMHTMTSSWGPLGPARDRFFGFDKTTGAHVWTSTPGGPPKDSPYSYPVFEWRDGARLLYAGTAGGNIVCVNARTGEPVWRYQISIGGVCASPVLYGDALIAVHGKENLDTSDAGRLVSIRLGAGRAEDGSQRVLDSTYENWRVDGITSFTSSPVLVGNRIYVTVFTGDLLCIDADNGAVLWSEKLAPAQIHASPAYADGKLYVPMENGTLHVLRPHDDGPEILSQTQLDGSCLGAPSVWNGKVYVHTTERLYCFGNDASRGRTIPAAELRPLPGRATALQIMPAEVLVTPGQTVTFSARSIDANGLIVDREVGDLVWTGNPLGVSFSDGGRVASASGLRPGAGVLTAEAGGLKGSVRFRVVYPHTFREDFESIAIDPASGFGRPPGFWIGGFPKWDVRQVDGSAVLAKTLANPILMRTMGFFGDPEMSEYTLQADIMTDGNRRMMSNAGLVNQRYLIALKGTHRHIEISSNVERIKHEVPFRVRPGVWYTLKTRVDLGSDGAATVRAKAWPRDEPEPDAWTAIFVHANGHANGAPGLWGFAPQVRHAVYMDNISVTPNE